ncbi:MAG: hypothetical protein RMJ28_06700 [Nitrososphaerota archaeon]|nr:hypothetical protein [Candidatus Calditenuaceae archaeon]MDW8073903.1 hypothetical protein [Nitrososphaerota archaeon]
MGELRSSRGLKIGLSASNGWWEASRRTRRGRTKWRRRKPFLVFLSIVFLAALGGAAYTASTDISKLLHVGPTRPRAAIVDGLSEDLPNPELIRDMAERLESAGYVVEIFNGSGVSVDFFRRLPSMDFSLIIMRLHGGRLRQPIGLLIGSGLFAEPFNENKYLEEYLSGYLLRGVPYVGDKDYFVITPHFVSDKLEGRFRGSAIVVLSCYSAVDEVLASAFLSRGASAFVGVDNVATDIYLDRVGLELVRNIAGGMSLREAYSKTVEEVGPDPETGASLRYYDKR